MKRIWEREMWIVLGFLAGCFALGMAGGILFANLAYPCRNGQNQILELYALTQIKKKEGKSTEYFCYLLGKQNICSSVFYTDGTYRCRALYCGGSGSLDGISCRCGGKPFDSGTWTGGIPDFCRFFISTGFCIFSCSCTVDDKNLQRRGKYLEETGKSNKNLFFDRFDRNDSVSFRCCF